MKTINYTKCHAPELPRFPTGTWVAVILLSLAGCLVYGNNLNGEFIFDDYQAIVNNREVNNLFPIWHLLNPAPDTPLSARPVPAISFALNYMYGGLDVRGYHLVNNLIHLCSALILFFLIRNTLMLPQFSPRFRQRENLYALAVSILWLVHPLNTEAVNYLVQRTELLMGFFYLLTLHLSIQGFSSGRPGWLSAAVLACALGMASKEVMVSAPLLVLLYDRLFIAGSFRSALSRRRIFYIALATTWLVILYYQMESPRKGSVALDYANLTTLDYLLTQTTVVFHYLRLAFWPSPLVLDSQDWPIMRNFSSTLIVPGTLLAFWVGITCSGVLKGRWWSFPGVWFFAILAPTSSFLPILTETVAERRMYLPLIAVLVLILFALDEIWRKITAPPALRSNFAKATSLLLLAFMTFVLGYRTWDRNKDYSTAVTIWEDTVDKRPGNARARDNLGKALFEKGLYNEAIIQFREALRLYSATQSNANLGEIYSVLGVALSQLDKFQEALTMHQRSLELLPQDAMMPFRLGNTYLKADDLENAAISFRKAIALNPNFAAAQGNLGMLLMQKGDYNAAEQHLQTLLKLIPDDAAPYTILADLRILQGRTDEAIQLYRQALKKASGAPDIEARLNDILSNLTKSGT